MASPRSKQIITEDGEIDHTTVTDAPDDWEFETVHDESPTLVAFEEMGDRFVGQYKGVKNVPANAKDPDSEPFDIYLFRGRNGALYGIYNSFMMDQGMEKVAEDQWVRITLVGKIPAKKGNPMLNLRIDVKKD